MKPTARTTATTWIILALAGGGSFMLPETLPTVTPPPQPAVLSPPAPRAALPADLPTDPTEDDAAASTPGAETAHTASAETGG